MDISPELLAEGGGNLTFCLFPPTAFDADSGETHVEAAGTREEGGIPPAGNREDLSEPGLMSPSPKHLGWRNGGDVGSGCLPPAKVQHDATSASHDA